MAEKTEIQNTCCHLVDQIIKQPIMSDDDRHCIRDLIDVLKDVEESQTKLVWWKTLNG